MKLWTMQGGETHALCYNRYTITDIDFAWKVPIGPMPKPNAYITCDRSIIVAVHDPTIREGEASEVTCPGCLENIKLAEKP